MPSTQAMHSRADKTDPTARKSLSEVVSLTSPTQFHQTLQSRRLRRQKVPTNDTDEVELDINVESSLEDGISSDEGDVQEEGPSNDTSLVSNETESELFVNETGPLMVLFPRQYLSVASSQREGSSRSTINTNWSSLLLAMKESIGRSISVISSSLYWPKTSASVVTQYYGGSVFSLNSGIELQTLTTATAKDFETSLKTSFPFLGVSEEKSTSNLAVSSPIMTGSYPSDVLQSHQSEFSATWSTAKEANEAEIRPTLSTSGIPISFISSEVHLKSLQTKAGAMAFSSTSRSVEMNSTFSFNLHSTPSSFHSSYSPQTSPSENIGKRLPFDNVTPSRPLFSDHFNELSARQNHNKKDQIIVPTKSSLTASELKSDEPANKMTSSIASGVADERQKLRETPSYEKSSMPAPLPSMPVFSGSKDSWDNDPTLSSKEILETRHVSPAPTPRLNVESASFQILPIARSSQFVDIAPSRTLSIDALANSNTVVVPSKDVDEFAKYGAPGKAIGEMVNKVEDLVVNTTTAAKSFANVTGLINKLESLIDSEGSKSPTVIEERRINEIVTTENNVTDKKYDSVIERLNYLTKLVESMENKRHDQVAGEPGLETAEKNKVETAKALTRIVMKLKNREARHDVAASKWPQQIVAMTSNELRRESASSTVSIGIFPATVIQLSGSNYPLKTMDDESQMPKRLASAATTTGSANVVTEVAQLPSFSSSKVNEKVTGSELRQQRSEAVNIPSSIFPITSSTYPGISQSDTSSQAAEQTVASPSQSPTTNTKARTKKPPSKVEKFNRIAKKCQAGLELHPGYSLRGGFSSGLFSHHSDIKTLAKCIRKCCATDSCTVVLMLQGNCFNVRCKNKWLCGKVENRSKNVKTTLVFVNKGENGVASFPESMTVHDDDGAGGVQQSVSSENPRRRTTVKVTTGSTKATRTTERGVNRTKIEATTRKPKFSTTHELVKKNNIPTMPKIGTTHFVKGFRKDEIQTEKIKSKDSQNMTKGVKPTVKMFHQDQQESSKTSMNDVIHGLTSPSQIKSKTSRNQGSSSKKNELQKQEVESKGVHHSENQSPTTSSDPVFHKYNPEPEVSTGAVFHTENAASDLKFGLMVKKMARNGTLRNDSSQMNLKKCEGSEVHYDSVLAGGWKAGEFERHGEISHMVNCMRKCCEIPSCHVAMLMVRCYTVHCFDVMSCEPKRPNISFFKPKLVFMRAPPPRLEGYAQQLAVNSTRTLLMSRNESSGSLAQSSSIFGNSRLTSTSSSSERQMNTTSQSVSDEVTSTSSNNHLSYRPVYSSSFTVLPTVKPHEGRFTKRYPAEFSVSSYAYSGAYPQKMTSPIDETRWDARKSLSGTEVIRASLLRPATLALATQRDYTVHFASGNPFLDRYKSTMALGVPENLQQGSSSARAETVESPNKGKSHLGRANFAVWQKISSSYKQPRQPASSTFMAGPFNLLLTVTSSLQHSSVTQQGDDMKSSKRPIGKDTLRIGLPLSRQKTPTLPAFGDLGDNTETQPIWGKFEGKEERQSLFEEESQVKGNGERNFNNDKGDRIIRPSISSDGQIMNGQSLKKQDLFSQESFSLFSKSMSEIMHLKIRPTTASYSENDLALSKTSYLSSAVRGNAQSPGEQGEAIPKEQQIAIDAAFFKPQKHRNEIVKPIEKPIKLEGMKTSYHVQPSSVLKIDSSVSPFSRMFLSFDSVSRLLAAGREYPSPSNGSTGPSFPTGKQKELINAFYEKHDFRNIFGHLKERSKESTPRPKSQQNNSSRQNQTGSELSAKADHDFSQIFQEVKHARPSMVCSGSHIIKGSVLTLGWKAGKFSDGGPARNISECLSRCCENGVCNVALFVKHRCFLVHCKYPESCSQTSTDGLDVEPSLAYVPRNQNEVSVFGSFARAAVKEMRERELEKMDKMERNAMLLSEALKSQQLPVTSSNDTSPPAARANIPAETKSSTMTNTTQRPNIFHIYAIPSHISKSLSISATQTVNTMSSSHSLPSSTSVSNAMKEGKALHQTTWHRNTSIARPMLTSFKPSKMQSTHSPIARPLMVLIPTPPLNSKHLNNITGVNFIASKHLEKGSGKEDAAKFEKLIKLVENLHSDVRSFRPTDAIKQSNKVMNMVLIALRDLKSNQKSLLQHLSSAAKKSEIIRRISKNATDFERHPDGSNSTRNSMNQEILGVLREISNKLQQTRSSTSINSLNRTFTSKIEQEEIHRSSSFSVNVHQSKPLVLMMNATVLENNKGSDKRNNIPTPPEIKRVQPVDKMTSGLKEADEEKEISIVKYQVEMETKLNPSPSSNPQGASTTTTATVAVATTTTTTLHLLPSSTSHGSFTTAATSMTMATTTTEVALHSSNRLPMTQAVLSSRLEVERKPSDLPTDKMKNLLGHIDRLLNYTKSIEKKLLAAGQHENKTRAEELHKMIEREISKLNMTSSLYDLGKKVERLKDTHQTELKEKLMKPLIDLLKSAISNATRTNEDQQEAEGSERTPLFVDEGTGEERSSNHAFDNQILLDILDDAQSSYYDERLATPSRTNSDILSYHIRPTPALNVEETFFRASLVSKAVEPSQSIQELRKRGQFVAMPTLYPAVHATRPISRADSRLTMKAGFLPSLPLPTSVLKTSSETRSLGLTSHSVHTKLATETGNVTSSVIPTSSRIQEKNRPTFGAESTMETAHLITKSSNLMQIPFSLKPSSSVPRDDRRSLRMKIAPVDDELDFQAELNFLTPKSDCRHTDILTNVTLKHGITAGTFKQVGTVRNMTSCLSACCNDILCDAAFMLGNHCVVIYCKDVSACETIEAKKSHLNPRLSFVIRGKPGAMRNANAKNAGMTSDKSSVAVAATNVPLPVPVTTPKQSHSGFTQMRHVTSTMPFEVWKVGTAGRDTIPTPIHQKVLTSTPSFTLGGRKDRIVAPFVENIRIHAMSSFRRNQNSQGIDSNLENRTTDSVINTGVVKVAPSDMNGSLGPQKWLHNTDRSNTSAAGHTGDIPQTVAKGMQLEGSTRNLPLCSYSPISYNVTLRHGLESGYHKDQGSVSAEECSQLCCQSPGCDVAFMLSGNCYSVNCPIKQMCELIGTNVPTLATSVVFVQKRESTQSVSVSEQFFRKEPHSVATGSIQPTSASARQPETSQKVDRFPSIKIGSVATEDQFLEFPTQSSLFVKGNTIATSKVDDIGDEILPAAVEGKTVAKYVPTTFSGQVGTQMTTREQSNDLPGRTTEKVGNTSELITEYPAFNEATYDKSGSLSKTNDIEMQVMKTNESQSGTKNFHENETTYATSGSHASESYLKENKENVDNFEAEFDAIADAADSADAIADDAGIMPQDAKGDSRDDISFEVLKVPTEKTHSTSSFENAVDTRPTAIDIKQNEESANEVPRYSAQNVQSQYDMEESHTREVLGSEMNGNQHDGEGKKGIAMPYTMPGSSDEKMIVQPNQFDRNEEAKKEIYSDDDRTEDENEAKEIEDDVRGKDENEAKEIEDDARGKDENEAKEIEDDARGKDENEAKEIEIDAIAGKQVSDDLQAKSKLSPRIEELSEDATSIDNTASVANGRILGNENEKNAEEEGNTWISRSAKKKLNFAKDDEVNSRDRELESRLSQKKEEVEKKLKDERGYGRSAIRKETDVNRLYEERGSSYVSHLGKGGTFIVSEESRAKHNCKQKEIKENIIFAHGSEGKQLHELGHVDGMLTCIELCCISDKRCDAVLLLDDICYSVACDNEKACATVASDNIAYKTSIAYMDGKGNGLHGTEHASIGETGLSPIKGMAAKSDACMSNTFVTGIMKGGLNAGEITRHGNVKDERECLKLCCKDSKCNVAFLIKKHCYGVKCKDAFDCTIEHMRPSWYSPRIALVRGIVEGKNHHTIHSIVKKTDIPQPEVLASFLEAEAAGKEHIDEEVNDFREDDKHRQIAVKSEEMPTQTSLSAASNRHKEDVNVGSFRDELNSFEAGRKRADPDSISHETESKSYVRNSRRKMDDELRTDSDNSLDIDSDSMIDRVSDFNDKVDSKLRSSDDLMKIDSRKSSILNGRSKKLANRRKTLEDSPFESDFGSLGATSDVMSVKSKLDLQDNSESLEDLTENGGFNSDSHVDDIGTEHGYPVQRKKELEMAGRLRGQQRDEKLKEEEKLAEERKKLKEEESHEEEKLRVEKEKLKEEKLKEEVKLKEKEEKFEEEEKIKKEEKLKEEKEKFIEEKIQEVKLKQEEEEKAKEEDEIKEKEAIEEEEKIKEQEKIKEEEKLREEEKLKEEIKIKEKEKEHRMRIEKEKVKEEEELKEEERLKEQRRLRKYQLKLEKLLGLKIEKQKLEERKMKDRRLEDEMLHMTSEEESNGGNGKNHLTENEERDNKQRKQETSRRILTSYPLHRNHHGQHLKVSQDVSKDDSSEDDQLNDDHFGFDDVTDDNQESFLNDIGDEREEDLIRNEANENGFVVHDDDDDVDDDNEEYAKGNMENVNHQQDGIRGRESARKLSRYGATGREYGNDDKERSASSRHIRRGKKHNKIESERYESSDSNDYDFITPHKSHLQDEIQHHKRLKSGPFVVIHSPDQILSDTEFKRKALRHRKPVVVMPKDDYDELNFYREISRLTGKSGKDDEEETSDDVRSEQVASKKLGQYSDQYEFVYPNEGKTDLGVLLKRPKLVTSNVVHDDLPQDHDNMLFIDKAGRGKSISAIHEDESEQDYPFVIIKKKPRRHRTVLPWQLRKELEEDIFSDAMLAAAKKERAIGSIGSLGDENPGRSSHPTGKSREKTPTGALTPRKVIQDAKKTSGGPKPTKRPKRVKPSKRPSHDITQNKPIILSINVETYPGPANRRQRIDQNLEIRKLTTALPLLEVNVGQARNVPTRRPVMQRKPTKVLKPTRKLDKSTTPPKSTEKMRTPTKRKKTPMKLREHHDATTQRATHKPTFAQRVTPATRRSQENAFYLGQKSGM